MAIYDRASGRLQIEPAPPFEGALLPLRDGNAVDDEAAHLRTESRAALRSAGSVGGIEQWRGRTAET